MCGFLQPSSKHAKRICRILNEEWWRQARHFKDCLRVVCATQQGGSHNKFFRDWCKTSDKVADWLWDNSRPHLPRPKKPKPTDGKVITLGDCAIPKDYKKILGLGPKFCFEPSFTPPEKVALTKNLARRVLEEERPRFITECVDVLKRTSTTSGKQQHVRTLVDFGISNNLRFLTSDKEGCFVILPDGLFQTKALSAVKKNFVPVNKKASKVKEEAVALLLNHNLEKLASTVKRATNLHLELFFAAKTHKPDVPFRCIVSERDSWQLNLSTFLQEQLVSLKVSDPFCVPNSEALVAFLTTSNPGTCNFFSVDVQDLYYNIPHGPLLTVVRKCITDDNDEIEFVNKCGISVGAFLELLSFYLRSTFIKWHDELYLQRSGICIGSKVAPILSNIFLGYVNKKN